MKISERKLRRVIKNVIRESYNQTFQVEDKVRVMHVDPPYTGHRMDWGGCIGIITHIYNDPDQKKNMCQDVIIRDPSGELELLRDIPVSHLEKV